MAFVELRKALVKEARVWLASNRIDPDLYGEYLANFIERNCERWVKEREVQCTSTLGGTQCQLLHGHDGCHHWHGSGCSKAWA